MFAFILRSSGYLQRTGTHRPGPGKEGCGHVGEEEKVGGVSRSRRTGWCIPLFNLTQDGASRSQFTSKDSKETHARACTDIVHSTQL